MVCDKMKVVTFNINFIPTDDHIANQIQDQFLVITEKEKNGSWAELESPCKQIGARPDQ